MTTAKQRRKKRSSGDVLENGDLAGDNAPHQGSPKAATSKDKLNLLINSPDKYKSMRTRVFSAIWMIAGFVLILYLGHVYIWAMIVGIQLLMAKELFTLARAAAREKQMPFFRVICWHFFFTGMLFVYGRFLNTQLTVAISSDKMLSKIFLLFLRYHGFICYSMYTAGLVVFVLSLRKGMYQYQFGQFAWTHMILFVVFAQSSFTVANVFDGIFWFLLPVSLIIINDISAYFFGFFFGRTPLIKLSPKKTWEGFIGASVTTMVSAYVLAGILGKFPWMTCPRKDLSTGWLYCDPGPLFEPHRVLFPRFLFSLFSSLGLNWHSFTYLPVQRHALAYGLFASSIAPFGGFFASGFKRAFKIKDFGDSLPGHGGMTDRMDCQMVIALFSYIYYQSFIESRKVSLEMLLARIVKLSLEQQFDLYQRLGNVLYGEGVEAINRSILAGS